MTRIHFEKLDTFVNDRGEVVVNVGDLGIFLEELKATTKEIEKSFAPILAEINQFERDI